MGLIFLLVFCFPISCLRLFLCSSDHVLMRMVGGFRLDEVVNGFEMENFRSLR